MCTGFRFDDDGVLDEGLSQYPCGGEYVGMENMGSSGAHIYTSIHLLREAEIKGGVGEKANTYACLPKHKANKTIYTFIR